MSTIFIKQNCVTTILNLHFPSDSVHKDPIKESYILLDVEETGQQRGRKWQRIAHLLFLVFNKSFLRMLPLE